jgi:hypothetical protein
LEVVDDADQLYRRVVGYYIFTDAQHGVERISSSALKEKKRRPERDISVEIARLTDPQTSLAGAPNAGFRLIGFIARVPRSLGLDVVHDPVPDCYAHALITVSITADHCIAMVEAAVVVV